MDPHKRIHFCYYGVIRSCFRVVCIDINQPIFTFNVGYCLWILLLIWGLFGSLYTITHYEMLIAGNTITIVPMCIQAIVKYVFLHDSRCLCNATVFMIGVYRKNSNAWAKYRFFVFYANISKYIMAVLFGFILSSAFVYITYPVVYYLLSGERTTILPIFFPGLNEKTIEVFLILNVFHILLVTFVVFLLLAYDTTLSITFINLLMLADIFKMHIQEANLHLNGGKWNTAQQKKLLIYLITEYQKFSEYVQLHYY